MHKIAAAANDHQCRARKRNSSQPFAGKVVVRGTASTEDDGIATKECLGVAFMRDLFEIVQQSSNAFLSVPSFAGQDSLIAFDTGEGKIRLSRFDRSRKAQCSCLRPHAGSGTGIAYLEKNLKGPLRSSCLRRRREHLHVLDRISKTVEVETGAAIKFINYPAHVLPTDEFVCEQDTLETKAPENLRLIDACYCKPPCASIGLQLRKLWRHIGLCVRAKHGPNPLKVLPHASGVGLQSALLKQRRRKRDVFAEERPALRTDICKAKRDGAAGDALRRGVDAHVQDVGQINQRRCLGRQ